MVHQGSAVSADLLGDLTCPSTTSLFILATDNKEYLVQNKAIVGHHLGSSGGTK